MKMNSLAKKVQELKNNVRSAVQSAEDEIREVNNILDIPNKKQKKDRYEEIDLEEAPVGSFEFLRDKVSKAFNEARIFAKELYSYVAYLYPDKIICSVGPDYYQVPYVIDLEGKVSFGKSKKVEQEFVAQEKDVSWFKSENAAEQLQESNLEITKEAVEMDLEIGDFITLKESTYNEDTGEVEAILIEAGTNPHKKRHYPKDTIKEAAPHFQGLKMYINHQTEKEEKERPERDLRDWASTVIESKYEDGKAVGKIAIHDKWLRERLKDPIARAHIGLSINAGGKISYGKVDGEEMQIVEKIVMHRQNGSASVDWVTEAGARGRVSRLLKESATAEKEEEENMKTLKEATAEDLQKENPELFKKIQESAKSGEKDGKELKEANEKIAKLERTQKLSEQKVKISAQLKESKIPEVAKTRIVSSLQETLFEEDAKLKEAVDLAVKTELEYINSLSEKGRIKIGSSNGAEGNSMLQNATESLAKRMGIKLKEETK